jgi:hypothetical protein
VQEYDLRTGKLLYNWDAFDHISPHESYASLPTNGFPWDAYHVNSIELLPGGKFLVSMRDTWAVYLVDIKTGKIEWTLGGRHSDFKLGPQAGFTWQHDVVLHRNSTLTMFDDHCCQITGGGTYVSPTAPSRALTLKLNQGARSATLAAQFSHGRTFDADYMGSAQPLPGGGMFVGWGSQPYFTQYDRSGKVLFDAVLPHPDLSYRTKVGQWVGLPLYPPTGVARSAKGKLTVYASWNGATRVVSWRVLAGTGGTLSPVATAAKSGFETAIGVRPGYKVFEVQALDAAGKVIGTSRRFS